MSIFHHFTAEMKSGTFAQTLNPDPFGIPKYRSSILHSGRPSFSRHHFSWCLDGHSTAAPLQLQTAGAAGSSRVLLLEYSCTLSLAAVSVGSLEHSGQRKRPALPFCNFGYFFFIIILWLGFCDFSGCLTTLGFPFLTNNKPESRD